MTIGKVIIWGSMIWYGGYLFTHRNDNLGATLLTIGIALIGACIDAAKDMDDYEPVKRTRKSKGFDKEAFERYQCYLIATNKKKR